jgi:hypothetical protein
MMLDRRNFKLALLRMLDVVLAIGFQLKGFVGSAIQAPNSCLLLAVVSGWKHQLKRIMIDQPLM